MKRFIRRTIVLSATLLTMVTFANRTPAQATYQGESKDRMADWVALESQEAALARTERLLKEAHARDSRPMLLWRAAEQHSRIASLHSRIGHAFPKTSQERQRASRTALSRSNERLSELLTQEASTTLALLKIRAHFLRGNQRLELGDQAGAEKDLLAVIERAPETDEASSARLTLSSLLTDQKHHERVLSLLKPLRDALGDPRRGLALYRSAWAAFNLTHFEQALSFVRDHTEALQEAIPGSSDHVIRENLLLDAAVFYAEAIERNDVCCRVERALERFKALGPKAPVEKMGLRLGKLLRSHRRASELENLSNQFLAVLPQHAEALEILLLILEDAMNHHRFQEVTKTAQRIAAHAQHSSTPESKAIQPLSETLERLTQLAQKNAEATEVRTLLSAHAGLSLTLLQMLQASDVRVPRVEFQLGETHFRLENYAEAAKAYRRAFSHPTASQGKEDLKSRANLHALGAQFKALYIRKPTLQSAASAKLDFSKLPEKLKSEPEIAEISQMIDTHPVEKLEEVSPFIQELHRILLSSGEWSSVVERSLRVAPHLKNEQRRIESITLALDLLVARGEWARIIEETQKVLTNAQSLPSDLQKRIRLLQGDSAYELLLSHSKEPSELYLQRISAFRVQFSEHPKNQMSLILEAEALQKMGNTDAAEKTWSRVAALPESSPARGAAHRHRIDAALKKDQRAEAAEEELRFAAWIKTQKIPGLLTSLLHAAELTLSLPETHPQKRELITRLRAEPALCGEWSQENTETCLLISAHPVRDILKAKAFKLSAQGRALLTLAELKQRLEVRERHFHSRLIETMQEIFAGWSEFPAPLSTSLEQEWTPVLVALFERHRAHLRDQRRMDADEWAIKRRARAIQDVEKVLPLVTSLGKKSRLAHAAIHWASELHADAAQDLRSIRKPRGMSAQERALFESQLDKLAAPFQERSKTLSQLDLSAANSESVSAESL